MDYKDKYIKYKTKYLELKNTSEQNQIGENKENYKIIKEIGMGMLGTVYMVQDKKNKKKYAMKIEKIFKEQANGTLKNRLGREMEFSNKMSKLYPQHFIKIYDNWIDSNCVYNHDWNKIGINIELLDKQTKLYYNKLFDSPYCSIKIYSLVDLTLKDLYQQHKIDENQYYNLFIQCLYVMYLCNKNGYLHQDWKMDNIGLIKTNKKFINIFDRKLKTHGYFVVLIDYGGIIHNKYILLNYEKKIFENNYTDLFFMFDRYRYNMIFNFAEFENEYNIDTFNPIKIDKITKKEIKKYLPDINSNNDILSQYLYKIFFYDKFEKQLVKNDIEPIKPKLLIPSETIKFIIKNIYDIKKCIVFMLDGI